MTQPTTALASASRDGYTEATNTANDYTCGDCGGRLSVLWRGDRYAALCARYPTDHSSLKSVRDIEKDEVRRRMEASPETARALATQGAQVPMTTQAIRELDNAKLLARIPARYGTAESMAVGPEQRLQLAQMSRLYGLDPLFDLMIYEYKAYITYDGRLRKLREHPEYRGHKVRPLNRAEKEEWSYDPGDIVIQCDVDMGARGIITEWGVVRKSEMDRAEASSKANNRKAAPVATHPQQIALKRAVARASRMAAGIDLPTVVEGSFQTIEIEQIRPQRPPQPEDAEAAGRRKFWTVARTNAPDGLGLDDGDVHRLLNVETVTGYPGGWDQALSDLTERASQDLSEQAGEAGWEDGLSLDTEPIPAAQPSPPMPQHMAIPPREGSPADKPTPKTVGARSALATRLAAAIEEAANLELNFDDCKVSFPSSEEEVLRKAEKLEARVQDKKNRLAGLTSPAPSDDIEQLPSF